MRKSTTACALVVGAVLVSLACSDDSNSPSSTESLNAAQAAALGEEVAIDVAEMIEASDFDPATGMGLLRGAAFMGGPPGSCTVDITPTAPANSDSDAVPDSVRFDYTTCVFTRGAMTHTLSGTIDVLDPTPTTTDLAVRMVFTSFLRSLFNSVTDKTVSALMDGERLIVLTSDSLTHTVTDFQTDYTFANGVTATHLKNWVGKFYADVPGAIVLGSPLPAGLFTLNGTSDWVRDGKTWDVVTATSIPLHFDPACTALPPFDAGKLTQTVTRGDLVTTIEIEFTNCGVYTVTRS
ncbi:MAG: hypothetical protein OEV95_06420 [Gemmatimonadota bacterium]|nr:hypothetical protein [Gemmatimonadota bacterium]